MGRAGEMRRALRFEFSRALGGTRFRFAAGAGLAIVLGHFFDSVLPLTRWLNAWEDDPLSLPHSAYSHWIGMDLATVWPVLLFLLLPLLAALPAADSAWWDRDSGYRSQIWLRCAPGRYRAAKAAAVFGSAFLAAAIPLTADLLLTTAALPCIPPEPATGLFPLGDSNLFGELFYRRPMAYLAGYLLYDCAFIAAWTMPALAAGRWLNHRSQVLLAPFLLFLLAYFAGLWLGGAAQTPLSVLLPFQPVAGLRPAVLFGWPAGALLAAAGLYLVPGRSADAV